MSGIRGAQVVAPQEFGGAHFQHHAIVLHHFDGLVASKVGRFDESIVLDAPWMPPALAAEIERLSLRAGAEDRIWRWGHADLVKEYAEATRLLGFDKKQLTTCLYGLRHGGASYDCLSRARTLLQIKDRGRLASDASVLRYRKASLAQSELAKLSTLQQRAAAILSRDLGRMFSEPQFLRRAMVGILA